MATVGDLSKKFGPQLDQLQAIFPDWDEQDLVFALQDSKGSVEDTVLAISEGRASQFTQATKKKPTKPAGSKVYGGRNADAGGWENAESFAGGGRGGRSGGRGGRGGGVARGMAAIRGARVGRAGARGGRGGFGNVNGGAKKTDGPSEGWPTTTATTIDGWSSQVEQAEAASAHEDDGGWGDAPASEPAKTEEPAAPVEAPKEVKEPVKRGAWGKELPKSMQSPKPPAPAPAAPAAAPAAPVAAAIAAPVAAPSPPPPAPVAAAAPAAPAPKPKMTWAQIAKPIEKPKPTPPPAPKAPEPQPEAVSGPEEPTQDEEEVVGEAEPEQFENEEPVETTPEVPEEPAAAEPEPVVAEVKPEEPAVEKPAAPAAAEESWASDPAIVGSAAPPAAAAPEPVTTYTGPPGFNTVASKAVGAQQPRTSSRGAQRFKNAGGEAVVLPAQASGVSAVEIQFGNLSFGGLNGDGVETPVQPEEPAAATSPIAHAAPIAPAAPAAAQSQASSWQQAAPQQSAGYPSQAQAQQTQAYESYGQQQQPQQQETQQTQQPQQQQAQQSQYGYRQDGYYNPIGTQAQQGQQAEQSQQQQGQQAQSQQQQQQQQPQQPSYDQYGAGGFSNQWSGQQQPPQHNDYGHGRNFDSFSNTGYPRPPVDEPKQQTPTPAAPAQPQQNVPHQQQNQYYSALGNMGYYHPHSGPYNPYYQYGQTHNPGFQQYYPMAGRQLYGQPPAHQPPAPIPANKPTPPTHSPYGVPNPYPSSGFDDQSYGLGRFGESNKASGNLQSSAQSQQTPQPIGAGSLPQSGYPSQQGLHNFLGGGINTPTGSSASQQPNRPQAGTPEDSFKAQGAGQQSGGAAAGARGAQPQQPQTQQAFASYPYAGYQSHDWSPYGQQQHYGGSRNGGYSGGWQQ